MSKSQKEKVSFRKSREIMAISAINQARCLEMDFGYPEDGFFAVAAERILPDI
ncbi:hypothetical protein EW026_g1964 [Hermanssonia centrifuga]|uniref:Uncharacterized protein n=1 Tax=Hermanssonia centrifuga TaxID=98765 RepID=A0A4S4KQE9_9APHY|nr:hypothetical protein EW026_g1964 [Hermanssonia centrifuga]